MTILKILRSRTHMGAETSGACVRLRRVQRISPNIHRSETPEVSEVATKI